MKIHFLTSRCFTRYHKRQVEDTRFVTAECDAIPKSGWSCSPVKYIKIIPNKLLPKWQSRCHFRYNQAVYWSFSSLPPNYEILSLKWSSFVPSLVFDIKMSARLNVTSEPRLASQHHTGDPCIKRLKFNTRQEAPKLHKASRWQALARSWHTSPQRICVAITSKEINQEHATLRQRLKSKSIDRKLRNQLTCRYLTCLEGSRHITGLKAVYEVPCSFRFKMQATRGYANDQGTRIGQVLHRGGLTSASSESNYMFGHVLRAWNTKPVSFVSAPTRHHAESYWVLGASPYFLACEAKLLAGA
jgi:hypothetical protein